MIEEFTNEIKCILDDPETKNKQCVLQLCNINSNEFGTYNIDKEKYIEILNRCQDKFKKYKIFNLKEYIYTNMIMTVDRNKKESYKTEKKSHIKIFDKFMFFVKDREIISSDNFPILNKYHCIKLIDITQFNSTPIVVTLTIETYNKKKYYSVKISFYNKSTSKDWLISKLVQTYNNIFNHSGINLLKSPKRPVNIPP